MNDHFPITHDASAIERARVALAEGHLVGMPTETVYGLAADATNPEAIARVYAAKGRPKFNPLISHVPSIDMACEEGLLDERALTLAHTFWPGPLTLVVPVNPDGRTCELARAGLDTIALREPSHPVARALLELHDGPLADGLHDLLWRGDRDDAGMAASGCYLIRAAGPDGILTVPATLVR